MDGVPPGALLLRPLTKEDLPPLLALARAQGRNVTEQEYERFLSLEGARAFVITRDGALLGAATAMRYYEHGFLGPLLLRDDEQAASTAATGVAIALLAQLIERIQSEGVHVIEAEAAGVEELILGRMGFEVVRRTLVLERPGAPARGFAGSLPMEDQHLLDVGALDADVVGYGRKEYLLALRRDMPDGARVVERDGDVVGFVLLRRAPRGYHLGPLVTRAGDSDAAGMLVQDALAATAGAPVVALAPDEAPVIALLEKEGFRRVGELARMRAGGADAPGTRAPATQWALGGRITG
ncbi:MAG TPA: hypothetical protein VM370_05640 [Candidatus Thermoplasmatota archaeon]|nr:hypothetical protein [Candidatus Thermoplasmatota archaeon]